MKSHKRENGLFDAFDIDHWSLDEELERDLDFAFQVCMQNICKIVIDKSKVLELSLNWPSASSL